MERQLAIELTCAELKNLNLKDFIRKAFSLSRTIVYIYILKMDMRISLYFDTTNGFEVG